MAKPQSKPAPAPRTSDSEEAKEAVTLTAPLAAAMPNPDKEFDDVFNASLESPEDKQDQTLGSAQSDESQETETAPAQEEDQAAEETTEATVEADKAEDKVSDSDLAVLTEHYGSEFADKVRDDPVLHKNVQRALTAIRQKEKDKLTRLEEAARIKDGYDALFQKRPDLLTALLDERGKEQSQPAKTEAAKPGLPPDFDNFEKWDVSRLKKFLGEELPSVVEAKARDIAQEMVRGFVPTQEAVMRQERDRIIHELEAKGYGDLSPYADRIVQRAAAMVRGNPEYTGKNDMDFLEAALWGIPELRARFMQAKTKAETSAEVERQTKVKKEATTAPQKRSPIPKEAQAVDILNHLRAIRARGGDVDAELRRHPDWEVKLF